MSVPDGSAMRHIDETEAPDSNVAPASKIAQAIDLLSRVSGKDAPLTKRLKALSIRLQNKHLQIAVLGQFKRGKSTLINSLLGVAILPTGVVPLTAVPTFIGWSEQPLIRVSFLNGKPSETLEEAEIPAMEEYLSRFVTEERNPKNVLAVERIDLLYPSPLLRDGTILIDTPGIGSTLSHNTEAAVRVIPECDASLFIVSADPPITQAELDYLRALRGKIGHVFFIMNKKDYLSIPELRQSIEFLHSVLAIESLFPPDIEIFAVSARSGLSAKQRHDHEGLEQSGVVAVERRLEQFAKLEKVEALRTAIARKAADIVELAESEVALHMETLRIPLDTLERKAGEFAASLKMMEARRIAISDMLAGEKGRLIGDLERQIVQLRDDVISAMTRRIDAVIQSPRDRRVEVDAMLANNLESEFLKAREQLVSMFARRAEGIAADYQLQIDALISDVRRTAADIFKVAYAFRDGTEGFRLNQEPYWLTERVQTGLLPDLSPFVDRFLPKIVRIRRERQRIIGQATELIIRNAENLRWAILRGLEETFRALAAHFDEMLQEAVRATKGVVDEALERRAQRSFENAPILESLQRYRDELRALSVSLDPAGVANRRLNEQ